MNKYKSFMVVSLVAIIFGVVGVASAQTNNNGLGKVMMNRNGQGSAIVGTVSSVSGNIIMVSAKKGLGEKNNSTATTYTVDATNAKITKGKTAGTISSIVVGDKVMVQGTITGTNVVAKNIRDGVLQPQIQGNGQPIVAGKITAISGNTITITNGSNVAYTVDATNAKFEVKGAVTPTISNIAVGDNVVVQGTVNGNMVTASSVIDQKAQIKNNTESTNNVNDNFMGGMMRGMGNFFKRMFGF
jgi:hypothetical protein